MGFAVERKIWANSGDSHFLEPADIFTDRLPAALAERMPRAVKSDDGRPETVYIDGTSFVRPLPKPLADGEFKGQTIETLSARPPGALNTYERLKDLDQEGIWGEITFPSLGMWANMIKDPVLVREGSKAVNDWAMDEIQNVAPDRLIATAMLPLLDVEGRGRRGLSREGTGLLRRLSSDRPAAGNAGLQRPDLGTGLGRDRRDRSRS